jgi:hypothetical protein
MSPRSRASTGPSWCINPLPVASMSDGLREDVEALGLSILPFIPEEAETAGRLWLETRSCGLSLGDRACLSLGLRLGVPGLMTDRIWATLNLPLTVHSCADTDRHDPAVSPCRGGRPLRYRRALPAHRGTAFIPAALPAAAGAGRNSYRPLATEGRYTSWDRECSVPSTPPSHEPARSRVCRGLTVAGSTAMSIRSCRGPADWGWIPAASTNYIKANPSPLAFFFAGRRGVVGVRAAICGLRGLAYRAVPGWVMLSPGRSSLLVGRVATGEVRKRT